MLRAWRFDRSLNALRGSPQEPLAAYAAAPWPAPGLPAKEAAYLALDFELDGLHAQADILQAGWVPFEGRRLQLAEARSRDIRSHARLDDTAVTIHGIGEERAAGGQPIEDVLRELLACLAGRIVVAHAAAIERSAVRRMAKAVFGVELPVRTICTLALEQRIHPGLVGAPPYRLGASRKRYGLPAYPPHDALTDAIAAAELFQAQLTRLPPDITLGQLETG
jgi:DNA polymerase-3 subunit epsilon